MDEQATDPTTPQSPASTGASQGSARQEAAGKGKRAFALRLSPAMLAALERWAADEFRSVNGQMEFILHQALEQAGRGGKK